jgi:hypothetical protein
VLLGERHKTVEWLLITLEMGGVGGGIMSFVALVVFMEMYWRFMMEK